jgi:hypothetical protein
MVRAHEGRAALPLPGTIVEPLKAKPVAHGGDDDPIAAVLARTPVRRGQFATERIDPAFVEKALRDDAWRPRGGEAQDGSTATASRAPDGGTATAEQTTMGPAGEPGVWPGFDASRFRQALSRLRSDESDAKPPSPGMMSLGRRPDGGQAR